MIEQAYNLRSKFQLREHIWRFSAVSVYMAQILGQKKRATRMGALCILDAVKLTSFFLDFYIPSLQNS